MAAPTYTTTQSEQTVAEPARVEIAEAATWWYDWVNRYRVGAAALVGVIATQIATYFGYVFPAIGLPTLPWPLYNGVLGAPAEDYGTTGSYFVGQSIHFVNGIVFTILYAVLALHVLPFRNTHGGNILKGLLYSVVLTIISIGVLVPYAYVPKQGYGLFLFYGPDGWKLPAAVLVWHLIWGFFLGVLYQLRPSRSR
jgi:RsiW-degrading membrane proteinase PrsW (M82 family)